MNRIKNKLLVTEEQYYYLWRINQFLLSTLKIYLAFVCIFMFSSVINSSDGSILDWIWPDRNVHNYRTDIEHSDSSALPVIPFEFSENNDRFIVDMSKVLGIRLSDMDFCQQRVILSLKSSCNTLTDEELGKLAIALMNCQHVAEKRATIDCSAKVALSDCITQMTDEMKTSYGQILGRTKSVCLNIRQNQFRGMTEITINKLMAQVDRLRTAQGQLELSTLNSIDEITDGQLQLLDKQNELLKLADAQRLSAEENLKELLKEKVAIKNEQADLNLFVGKLRNKIEEGLNDLNEQNVETKQVFKNLFDDLVQINEISNRISQRLQEVDKLAIDHQKMTEVNFDGTLQKLKSVNDVVDNVSNKFESIKQGFLYQLQWLEPILGTGEKFSQRCNIIFAHMLYLLLGMVCLVFINATSTSRFLLLAIVLTSVLCTLNDFINFNIILLLEILIGLVVVNFFSKINDDFHLVQKVIDLFKSKSSKKTAETQRKEFQIPIHIETNGVKKPLSNEYNNNEYDDETEEISVTQSRSYSSLGQSRPSMRRISGEFDKVSNSSRTSTPLNGNDYAQYNLGRCKATTRIGTRCQLMTPSSLTDFCRIHERSSRER